MEVVPTDENIEIVKRIYKWIAEANIEAVAATLAPDIELVEPAGMIGGGSFHGREAVRNLFADMGTRLQDISIVPHTFVDGGDVVAVLGTFSGTAIETGKSVEYQGAHVFEFVDGKIAKWTGYADTALFNAAFEA